MGDTHYGNAMTEVALALAMAFFSIMILAMVSMGAGGAADRSSAEAPDRTIAARLAAAAPDTPAAATTTAAAADTLLIYHEGRFLDRDMAPVDPAAMTFPGRVVLALPPDLAMAEALAARAKVATENLIVSMLNQEWLGALARAAAKEK